MNRAPEVMALSVGPFESNCFLMAGDGACLLVDPGDDAERIVLALQQRDLRPDAILLTHGHVDHITGLPGLLKEYPAPVFLHPADAAWAFQEVNRLPPWYNEPPAAAPADLRDPRTPDPLVIGAWSFRLLETPGHSPGSVCYYLPDHALLFSGDTLFRGSIGRTDLPGGNAEQMADSLRRLAALPPETRIFPGHGPATSLAEECRVNPWL